MTFESLHIRRFAWLGVLVILAVLAAPVWAQSSPPGQVGGEDGPVNATCPVTTDEAVDPRFTASYEGKTIGFCCRKCLTKFQADPAAYVANLPVSFSQAAQDSEDPHEHADHDESHEHADEATPASANAGTHEAEHDHEHSHESEGRSKLAVWIGKLHPPATHLPIGLLIGAAVAEIGMIFTRKEWFRLAAGFCLVLGTLGALGAATLGDRGLVARHPGVLPADVSGQVRITSGVLVPGQSVLHNKPCRRCGLLRRRPCVWDQSLCMVNTDDQTYLRWARACS